MGDSVKIPDRMKIPRLLIAGTHSGAGKTTVMMGLLQALAKRGIAVQPFMSGPDYIDPGFHSQVSGRPCRNLDSWLVPPQGLLSLFRRAIRGADLALIEGMMGLYDGIGPLGEEGSTAQLAKRLRCPVLLVLDAGSLSRSAAAVVRGYVQFDRQVKIAGCFLNRVGGGSHFRLIKEAVEKLAGIPVVGFLPQDERLRMPERHLGLVPSCEDRGWRQILAPLSARMREGVDLSSVQRLAHRAEPLPIPSSRGLRPRGEAVAGSRTTRSQEGLLPPPASALPRSRGRNDGRMCRVPIAVAMDEAFHFYYPENLELLEDLGAKLIPFSPLCDAALPSRAAALYLGGGFPEVYAPRLARNSKLIQAIRKAVSAGLPTYAECGGLMYLARSLADSRGRSYPMAGLIPAEIQMTDRLRHFGYQRLRARKDSLLTRTGEEAKGHEFHHSVCRGIPVRKTAAYEAAPAAGEGRRIEGYARGNLLASYIHLHFLSQPRWAERFVQAARKWKGVKGGGWRKTGEGCRV